jgi:hypothetical protein
MLGNYLGSSAAVPDRIRELFITLSIMLSGLYAFSRADSISCGSQPLKVMIETGPLNLDVNEIVTILH